MGSCIKRMRDPLAVCFAHDRTVMRAIDGEFLLRHPVIRLVRHRDFAHRDGTLFGAVLVEVAVALLRHGFEILVDGIDAAGGVHPTGAVVEALVDEELAPGDGAVGIEAFVAHHLQFGAEEERRVRIDQQQRVMRRRCSTARWRCRSIPGSGEFVLDRRAGVRCAGRLAVERLQLVEVDPLDVAADAALA